MAELHFQQPVTWFLKKIIRKFGAQLSSIIICTPSVTTLDFLSLPSNAVMWSRGFCNEFLPVFFYRRSEEQHLSILSPTELGQYIYMKF